VTIRRFAQALTLAAAALLLAACASGTLTRIAYANAAIAYANLGPMVEWMADDYVDLSDAQEDWVRGRVARLMQWHRTEELPRYREFLESTLVHVDRPFTAQDVAEHDRMLRARYFRLVERVVPDVAEFLAGIGPEQVAQLERKFADDNARFVRESLKGKPEERRMRRMRRFVDHLEAWIGGTTPQQRELIAAHYRKLPDFSEEMLGERRFRQAEILALVKAHPPAQEMGAGLRRLFVESAAWRRPDYAEKLRLRDQQGFEMLASLSATLSPQQRAALQKRIRGFLRDIDTLTASS
jgi:hypothetical protein